MMDLTARRTGHRFTGVPVLGGIFGGEALNRVSKSTIVCAPGHSPLLSMGIKYGSLTHAGGHNAASNT
jgi:hypothetical protein